MLLLKPLGLAILIGLIGLLVGPLVALVLMSPPEGACGMYWVIPGGLGAMGGLAVGALLGLIMALMT